MISYIVKGGPVMIPIIIGSILGLAIIIEKLVTLHRKSINVEKFRDEVFSLIRKGDYSQAVELSDRCGNKPISVLFKAALERRNLSPQELERVLERIGNSQVKDLEKYIGGLVSIIGIEPLLGFLGTITGLIRAFMSWEKAGANVTVSSLASGIYEAMITTAAGLMVAVPYYLICNYIISRVKYTSYELSDSSMRMIEVLSETRNSQ